MLREEEEVDEKGRERRMKRNGRRAEVDPLRSWQAVPTVVREVVLTITCIKPLNLTSRVKVPTQYRCSRSVSAAVR
jgi:hypothetical protein